MVGSAGDTVRFGRGEQLGQEPPKYQSHRRHRSADHAYVDLDGGPVDDIRLVPGGVTPFAESDQKSQAHD